MEQKVVEKSRIDQFVNALKMSKGLIYSSLVEAGLKPEEVFSYFSEKEWEELKDFVTELRHDFVEEKLLDLISEGDPMATVFYCSTRLKSRGYKK